MLRLIISNYPDSKKPNTQVAHLKLSQDSDKPRGYFKGITPELLLAILDGNHAEMRALANQSIAQAMSANRVYAAPVAPPAAPVCPPPTAPAPKTYPCSNGDGNILGPLSESAMRIFCEANRDNPYAAVCVDGTWKLSSEWGGLGFVVPAAPAAPTAPVVDSSVPVAPPAPTAPVAPPAETVSETPRQTGGLSSLVAKALNR